MASIRTHDGPVFLCTTCGQPCYEEPDPEYGPQLQHFSEQWDGIHCDDFPLASGKIVIDWTRESLEDLKASYPDTYPRTTPLPITHAG